MQTNHIAVLVRNLDAVSRILPDACTRHALEEQPAEGTLEQYITVGDHKVPSLLLMQAIADGPYKRALEKRGPGLHHIGCVCTNIDDEIAAEKATRLLLHPISLKTRRQGIVWLCRPGIPYLIELVENAEQDAICLQQASLLLPAAISLPEYAGALSSNLTIKTSEESSLVVRIGGVEISFDPSLG